LKRSPNPGAKTLLGIVAAAYHVSNGIATGAEGLGLSTTATTQKWIVRACLVLGLGLLLAGLAAWHALAPKQSQHSSAGTEMVAG